MGTVIPVVGKSCFIQSLAGLRQKSQFMCFRTAASKSTSSSEITGTVKEVSDPDLPLENVQNPFEKEKIKCILCEHNIKVDYKNVRLLSQFVSRYTGRPYGRHITNLCKEQQERVEKEILKAQNAGFMGYYTRDLEYANDPPLFNPDKPIRPHRF